MYVYVTVPVKWQKLHLVHVLHEQMLTNYSRVDFFLKLIIPQAWHRLVEKRFALYAGLWIWGYRVIKTLGEDLTSIVPSSGFTIEIGTALTVLLASIFGIPVSTTHCKVAAIVGVGYVRTKKNVDIRILQRIAAAWLVTIPAAAILSAVSMSVLREFA